LEKAAEVTSSHVRQSNVQLLAAQSQLLAVGLAEMQQTHQAGLERGFVHTERLSREARAYELSLDTKRKDHDKFLVGSSGLIELAREHGCHGDMTGAKFPVLKQIGIGMVTGNLFKALGAAAAVQDTGAVFTFEMTNALAWSLSCLSLGGAPNKFGEDLVYGCSASIYDFKPVMNRPPHRGIINLHTEVPARNKIVFVSDQARKAERFDNIWEATESWNALGTLVGMYLGPAWCPVFKACGEQLKVLHIGDQTVYNMLAIKDLSDKALKGWRQMLDQMATNPDFLPPKQSCEKAAEWGFAEVTVIPGDGFTPGQWMLDNMVEPYISDIKNLLRCNMLQQGAVFSGTGLFSGIPHVPLPTPAVDGRPRRGLGMRQEEVECEECVGEAEEVSKWDYNAELAEEEEEAILGATGPNFSDRCQEW
jgi:hypothetical protein